MKMIKPITAFLLIAILAVSFVSCADADKSPAVMTLEDEKITENTYKYWVCSYKADFLNTYDDMKNTEEFWNSPLLEDVTAEEYFSGLVEDYVKNSLVSMYLFDELGLRLTSDDRENAENIVNDLCDYSGGDREAFDGMLSVYGVDSEMLVEIYLDDFKMTYLYNHVFENGVLVVDDAAKQNYLEENYARIRQIYINNAYDSESSYYDSDGNFIMVPLDEETQKKQDAKVAEVEKLLSEGADFDSVYEKYSEEKEYKNGYYLCATTQGLPEELVTNSLTASVGDVQQFETIYGYHAFWKMEMDEGAYKNEENADFFEGYADSVYESVFLEYLQSYYDKITVDTEAVGKISIKDAVPNYSFQY